MPRVPSAKPAASSVTLVQRGAKNATKSAPIARPMVHEQQPAKMDEDKEVCPLCVEDLDETDKSFQPCPCGYRVCLFCFEKLKLLCNSVCPNCRRTYGSEEALAYAKKQEAERVQEAAQRSKGSSGPAAAASSSSTSSTAGSRVLPKPTATHSATRRDPVPVPVAKRASGSLDEAGGHEKSSGLPSGVTWANPSPNSLSRNQSVEMERPTLSMDEFSWPSLGAPAAQQPQPQQHAPRSHVSSTQHHQHGSSHSQQHQQQAAQHHQLHHNQQQQQAHASNGGGTQASSQQMRHSPSGAVSEGANSYDQLSGADTRRSSSVASSMDRVASSSSLELMSQDPPVTPEQLLQLQHQHQQYQAQHAQAGGVSSLSSSSSAFPPMPPPGFESSSYFGAQVATTVNGLRRAVNVPLSLGNSSVEPYPEAPALLASMQQGVAQGTVSSKEAAAQLFALLRQKDAESQTARARSLLAASKPPPGFGAPAHAPAAPANTSAAPQSLLSQPQAPPVRPPPPPGFSHLHGSVVQAPQLQRAPIQPPAQAGDGAFGTAAGPIGLNANGTPRTYSMWSGLPGMDLSASTGLTSLWQNLSASGLSLGGQLGGSANAPYNPLGLADQSVSYGARPPMSAAVPPKAPPPGFGPSVYVGSSAASQQLSSGDAVLGNSFRVQQPYQPVGATRYNPLNQPSVMPGVYRPPQLGAGL